MLASTLLFIALRPTYDSSYGPIVLILVCLLITIFFLVGYYYDKRR